MAAKLFRLVKSLNKALEQTLSIVKATTDALKKDLGQITQIQITPAHIILATPSDRDEPPIFVPISPPKPDGIPIISEK
tara:strand:+ start:457 stop:693 length:237 start_codon:yes stop_codon:yes gene_type:complete